MAVIRAASCPFCIVSIVPFCGSDSLLVDPSSHNAHTPRVFVGRPLSWHSPAPGLRDAEALAATRHFMEAQRTLPKARRRRATGPARPTWEQLKAEGIEAERERMREREDAILGPRLTQEMRPAS